MAVTLMTSGNPYCPVLGIDPPTIEAAKSRPDANYYNLLKIAEYRERSANPYVAGSRGYSRRSA